jgi:hypothetical protein
MARMKKLAVQLRELADKLETLDIGDVGIDCTINVFGGSPYGTQLTVDTLKEVVATFAAGGGNAEPRIYENSTWIRVTNGDLGAVIHYAPSLFGEEEVVQRVPVKLDLAKLLGD